METHARLGTFEDVLAKGGSEEIRAIASRLREVIEELHPDCVEVPRPGEPSAAYGVGPKKMSEAYAYIMPLANYVNLGFFHGANLAEFEAMLEGSGKRLRHVKIRTLAEAERDEIKALLRAARREREEAVAG
ncbi:MAG TPA: DUF1801 domain-containing protein [Anaerolineae bacterium]|nr:DUF1801 domain-containing protein [Anaerolineae bacterium]